MIHNIPKWKNTCSRIKECFERILTSVSQITFSSIFVYQLLPFISQADVFICSQYPFILSFLIPLSLFVYFSLIPIQLQRVFKTNLDLIIINSFSNYRMQISIVEGLCVPFQSMSKTTRPLVFTFVSRH